MREESFFGHLVLYKSPASKWLLDWRKKGEFFFVRNTELYYPKCGKAHDGERCLSLSNSLLTPSLLKCKPLKCNMPCKDQTANLEFSTPFLANVHTSPCDFLWLVSTVRPLSNFKFFALPFAMAFLSSIPSILVLLAKKLKWTTRREKGPFSV